MEVLRSVEASVYLDGLRDDRERSAVLAIHLTWLDNCSSLATNPRLVSQTPIDMLLLYRAAGIAFRVPMAGDAGLLVSGVNVVNHDEAAQRLDAVANSQKVQYARQYLREVIQLSDGASHKQDLLFFLNLFLLCLDRCTIESITSGKISRGSRQLADPDFWR